MGKIGKTVTSVFSWLAWQRKGNKIDVSDKMPQLCKRCSSLKSEHRSKTHPFTEYS